MNNKIPVCHAAKAPPAERSLSQNFDVLPDARIDNAVGGAAANHGAIPRAMRFKIAMAGISRKMNEHSN
jgi:hypothetical protein